MPKTYQAPTITKPKGAGTDHIEQHPAYGTISVSRISGSMVLFGSDFVHHNCIALRINTAEVERSLLKDWIFPKKRIVEVTMSEAQWATFVSSFNVGEGTPCTLEYVRDEGQLPGLLAPKDRSKEYNEELSKYLDRLRADVKELEALVEAAPLSQKAKKPLTSKLLQINYGLDSNLQFVRSQFGRHVEKTVERAKVEVYAWTQAIIGRLGLKALQTAGMSPEGPLLLEQPKPQVVDAEVVEGTERTSE